MNLKAYSQISDRGCSQNCQNLNFLHLFLALPLKTHFPKGIGQKSFQGEIRAIFPKIVLSENIFNTVVYGATSMLIIMLNLQNKVLVTTEFLEISILWPYLPIFIIKNVVRITDYSFNVAIDWHLYVYIYIYINPVNV